MYITNRTLNFNYGKSGIGNCHLCYLLQQILAPCIWYIRCQRRLSDSFLIPTIIGLRCTFPDGSPIYRSQTETARTALSQSRCTYCAPSTALVAVHRKTMHENSMMKNLCRDYLGRRDRMAAPGVCLGKLS